MGTPIQALGVTIERAGTLIPNVKSISGPSLNRETADTTPLDASNGFEEVIPTILRSNEVTLEMSHIPGDAVHLALESDVTSTNQVAFEIKIPTNSGTTESHSFNAYVLSKDRQMSPDGEVQSTVSLKPTGPITVTEA